MGHRVTQRILGCDLCNKIPDDGEYLWEMGHKHWCEECCDKDCETDTNARYYSGDAAETYEALDEECESIAKEIRAH